MVDSGIPTKQICFYIPAGDPEFVIGSGYLLVEYCRWINNLWSGINAGLDMLPYLSLVDARSSALSRSVSRSAIRRAIYFVVVVDAHK